MNTCCTCSTHARAFSLGKSQTDLNPTRSPGEKLEFVEHVLGVLIDSRHGDGNPYQRLGEATVMTGHSQMFANVRLLSAAEIQTHLGFGGAHHRPFYAALLGELPLASASGSWQQNNSGFSLRDNSDSHAKLAKDAKKTRTILGRVNDARTEPT